MILLSVFPTVIVAEIPPLRNSSHHHSHRLLRSDPPPRMCVVRSDYRPLHCPRQVGLRHQPADEGEVGEVESRGRGGGGFQGNVCFSVSNLVQPEELHTPLCLKHTIHDGLTYMITHKYALTNSALLTHTRTDKRTHVCMYTHMPSQKLNCHLNTQTHKHTVHARAHSTHIHFQSFLP